LQNLLNARRICTVFGFSDHCCLRLEHVTSALSVAVFWSHQSINQSFYLSKNILHIRNCDETLH